MAFIADRVDAELYEADEARLGYVANYTKAFAHRPAVYAAWQQLNGAIKAGMDERRYELVTLAAARRLRSSYCALAHGKVLAERLGMRDAVVDGAALSEVEVAVMELAERVVDDAEAITAAEVERLRELGLDDAEILDVVAAAAARCFFSKTLDALGVEPDAVYRELDPELRETLTVGRPIAQT